MTKYEYAYCPPRPDWQEANIDIIPAIDAEVSRCRIVASWSPASTRHRYLYDLEGWGGALRSLAEYREGAEGDGDPWPSTTEERLVECCEMEHERAWETAVSLAAGKAKLTFDDKVMRRGFVEDFRLAEITDLDAFENECVPDRYLALLPAATADGGDEVFNYEEGTSLRLSVTHGVATLYASASVRWLRSDEFPCDDYVEIVLARRAVRQ